MKKTYIIPTTETHQLSMTSVLCASGGYTPESIGVANGKKGGFIGD